MIEGYRQIIQETPRFAVVDATRNIDDVVNETYEIILNF